MTTPDINISQQCPDWPDVDQLINDAVYKIFELKPLETDEIELSIVLADDGFIQDLNKEWRQKDKPTNVLSFPQDHPATLGDVIFALETIQKEAVDQNKSFENHLTHLVIHGVLHLLGFDHETDTEAEEMEALEIKILGEMNIENPYVDVNSVS